MSYNSNYQRGRPVWRGATRGNRRHLTLQNALTRSHPYYQPHRAPLSSPISEFTSSPASSPPRFWQYPTQTSSPFSSPGPSHPAQNAGLDEAQEIAEYDINKAIERRLLSELWEFNKQGQMVTYVRAQEKGKAASGWKPFPRPIDPNAVIDITQLTASQVYNRQRVQELCAPLCAHAENPWRTDTTMKLRRTKNPSGEPKDLYYYQAEHNGEKCPFIVFWTPVVHAEGAGYPTDEKYQLSYIADVFGDGEPNMGWAEEDDAASTQALLQYFPNPVGIGLPSTPSTPSQKGPAAPPSASSSMRVRPRTRRRNDRPSSFYSLECAQARAKPDLDLIEKLTAVQASQYYLEHPSEHPGYGEEAESIHPALAVYAATSDSPHIRNAIAAHGFRFIHTDTGLTIAQLNSSAGIPASSYDLLKLDTIECVGCLCMFTVDGYNEHIAQHDIFDSAPLRAGSSKDRAALGPPPPPQLVSRRLICGNHPEGAEVTRMNYEIPRYERRTYPSDHVQDPIVDCLDAPVGQAFLAMNSRLGIPKDVWQIIFTAVVRCNDCGLLRTFAGDVEHRDGVDKCKDPGFAEGRLVGA